MSSPADWFDQPPGAGLWSAEQHMLDLVLARTEGFRGLQIGPLAESQSVISRAAVRHKIHLDSSEQTRRPWHGRVSEGLPITSDSIDLVVLRHCLSADIAGTALLQEVIRVLTDSGHLIVFTLNPVSWLGFRGRRAGQVPRLSNFWLRRELGASPMVEKGLWSCGLGNTGGRAPTATLRYPLSLVANSRIIRYRKHVIPGNVARVSFKLRPKMGARQIPANPGLFRKTGT